MLRTGTLGPSSCFVGDCHLPASQLFLPPRIGGGALGPGTVRGVCIHGISVHS